MSRRIPPRRDCDPVQIVQPFGFTAAQRQQILDALPRVRGQESEFIAGLERCAGKFLWLRNQYHADGRKRSKTPPWPKSVTLRGS